MQPTNIMNFLSAEHENLLISVHKYRADLNVLAELDTLFRAPLQFMDIPETNSAIGQLYLFTHFHLYTSVTNLLRLHVAEALASTRKAIDATLSAYVMILDRETIPLYDQRHNKFLFIKQHVERARKKDGASYPLAVELLEAWNICSEFGAHADQSSFSMRLKNVPVPNSNKEFITFHYFQEPASDDEGHFFFVDTYATYHRMLLIFALFIPGVTKNFDVATWKKAVGNLGALIDGEWTNVCAKLENEEEGDKK